MGLDPTIYRPRKPSMLDRLSDYFSYGPPATGSQVFKSVTWPEGYEPPSALPVPSRVAVESASTEAREIRDRISETIHRAQMDIRRKVEARLREIEAAGLLDQVEGVEWGTEWGEGYTATLTARIKFKEQD